MTLDTTRGDRRRAAPPILQNAFRPFFLGCAVWAAISLPLWILGYSGLLDGTATIASLEGHRHEMLFGFLPAMVGGFALTAIPNWTGRAPVAGLPLFGLFAIWAAGRAGAFFPDSTVWIVLDCAFLVVLAGVALTEILVGKNWRNLPIVVLISAFAAAHIAYHSGYSAAAIRGVLGVIIILMALIGGRITPSFTRNALAKQGEGALPQPFGLVDRVALITLVLAVLSWLVMPDTLPASVLMGLAGLGLFARLSRWQTARTLQEPLLWSLHAGYAWLAGGVLLIGAGGLWPAILGPSVGLHALTAGAIGAMGLAVMTRASLGHTGRALKADGWTAIIFALVHAGALLRVIGALRPDWGVLIHASGGVWSLAFGLFALSYGPMLFAPRVPAAGRSTPS